VPLKRLIQQALAVLRTLPGRLFLLSGGLLFVIAIWQTIAVLPDVIDVFRKVLVLAFLGSATWIFVQAFARGQRQWLWAVRRKLILSYVFFGVFPVALMLVFVFVASAFLYRTTAGYLFQAGYQRLVDDVAMVAETSAVEIGQKPGTALEVLTRKFDNRRSQFASLSLAALRRTGPDKFQVTTVGPWRHLGPPQVVPKWLLDKPAGFQGSIALVTATGDEPRLAIRAARASADGQEFVIVDLPVDADAIGDIHDKSGTNVSGIALVRPEGTAASPQVGNVDSIRTGAQSVPESQFGLNFRKTVAGMDFTDWSTGVPGRVAVGLEAPVGELYDRMSSAGGQVINATLLKGFLLALAVLFLIIQGSAFVGGVALARRITSAVYYLFNGTARIGQGDFTHRIPIGSNDQLGDLAGSFNNMSASIEHLRHVERDKLRLDEELQNARRIQRSLLPNCVPTVSGLCIADLCEPAMEVGGDYYDFFVLGPRQLGVLVADVSGKGTSAALYMAELKGLMLALSRTHRSPRALLVELNELLADHLDNRSFITMTYAVIDLDAGTLTCARAGHTPLLVISGSESHVIVPDGMVLGLRLPGAGRRFGELLQEYTQPVKTGDVIVLYTDGITEAMNPAGDLFGDAALSRVVVAQQHLDSAGIRERILRDVRAFVGEAEPHDDMTMVVLKIKDAA
jgi:serine phosphatase RsbU (regulator of sigma subunit)